MSDDLFKDDALAYLLEDDPPPAEQARKQALFDKLSPAQTASLSLPSKKRSELARRFTQHQLRARYHPMDGERMAEEWQAKLKKLGIPATFTEAWNCLYPDEPPPEREEKPPKPVKEIDINDLIKESE